MTTSKPTDTSSRIYHTVSCIPIGSVSSYGKIADLAGLPKRARVVGFWLKHAPKEMAIPWQRVLRSDGKIAFPFGSPQYEMQKTLLMEEGVYVFNGRVDLKQFAWQPDIIEMLQKLKY